MKRIAGSRGCEERLLRRDGLVLAFGLAFLQALLGFALPLA